MEALRSGGGGGEGGCGGEHTLLHTLGSQAHCVTFGACVHVANARVEQADVRFNGGVLHLLDSLLWALVPLSEVRVEQVRGKKVMPSPELLLLGAPDHATATLEVHALLVHRATGQLLSGGLRGHVRGVEARGAAVRFGELVIEHKPPSLVRKKGESVEEQRACSTTYQLAFSLFSREAGAHLSGAQLGGE